MRPRIRTIKPEIWQDERIGDLSHGARLLFIGLVTMADDEGRLRELPAAIIGHVFPYDDVTGAKLARWLKEVANAGAVVRYEVDGRRFIAFKHWTRHQKVDKPSASEFPAPPEFSSNDLVVFDDDSTNDRGTVDDHSRLAHTRASDPILSSPGLVVDVVEEKKPSRTQIARGLFDEWRGECGHLDAKYTLERRRKIEGRLDEGYTVEQIRLGITGAAKEPFVNDAGKRFDDIELICRNGSKLESFIERASSAGRVVPIRGGKQSAGDLITKINANRTHGLELTDGAG